MITPRYYFANDFLQFHDYLKEQPHTIKQLQNGEYLWAPNEPLTHTYYIETGIIETMVEHEDGHQKILSFHGGGTVFPGCHQANYKIEQSIVSRALSDVTVMSFLRDDFYAMFQSNKELNAQVFEWYAMYINLLIYETAHQEYNNTFLKLCNLLYLFSKHTASVRSNRIDLTQETIAHILTVNRVNVAKNLARLRKEKIIKTHRSWIEVIDFEALKSYCSNETIES